MSDIKYAPGRGPRRTSAGRPVTTIELVTVAHLMVFIVLSSWFFGGCSDTARMVLSWWGTVGAGILVVSIADKSNRKQTDLRHLHWLWPVAAFNALVLISCANPNLRTLNFGDDIGYVKIDPLSAWLPSSALPAEALKGLWLFDAIYLSVFSAVITVRQRRLLRAILICAGANAGVLAVFGTLQKLTHAKGLFFGAVTSPQPNFFASFVYDNHWGAYAVLMMAMLLGLAMRMIQRQSTVEFLKSPGQLSLFALLLLAISVPLSNSRSGTLLVTVLLAFGLGTWLWTAGKRRRAMKESVAVLAVAAGVAVAILLAATWYVAGDSIASRAATTRAQLADMKKQGGIGSRATLYHDTWRMAEDLPLFGWGTNSYPHVFMLYNTQESRIDDLPVFYHDAHNDVLQSLAEHGFVGTLLLAAAALLPLASLRRVKAPGPMPRYLLVGCLLILAYSAVEFPFGNPAVVLAWWLGLFVAVHYTLLDAAPPKKSV